MSTTLSRVVRAIAAIAILVAPLAPIAAPTALARDGATIDGLFSGNGFIAAGSTVQLDVTGRGGSANNATAVALNLTITQPSADGYATIYPCGTTRPDASTINYGPGTTIANAVTTKVGTNGRVCIYTHSRTHIIVDINGYFPAGTDYRPLTPARLLDTRPNQRTIDGIDAGSGVQAAGTVHELDVTGRGGSANNATAVALNLTITQPSADGYATIYPCGTTRPDASTINYGPGTTIANAVTTKVGTNGRVCIYTHSRTHIIVDINGYFPAGTDYRPLTPARLLDTRPNQRTIDGIDAGSGVQAAGTVHELDVTGRGGSANNATAVALNLTITQPSADGYATIYPCGTTRPDASTINYGPGTTIANAVTTKVGTNGRVCIYTHSRTHIIVDINGYFPAGTDYRPLTPARLLDTRPDQSVPDDSAAATSLALLNQLRAAHGVGPVVYDPAMSAQAQAWSQEMSRSGFRHSGGNYAENIAWHSQSAMSPTTAAETLHDMWVDSPGHFNNMLNPRWTRVGIGFHVDGSGWYGTHMFSD